MFYSPLSNFVCPGGEVEIHGSRDSKEKNTFSKNDKDSNV